MRSPDAGIAECTEVVEAEVVGHDDQDVGAPAFGFERPGVARLAGGRGQGHHEDGAGSGSPLALRPAPEVFW